MRVGRFVIGASTTFLTTVGLVTIAPAAGIGLGVAGTCTALGCGLGAVAGFIGGFVASSPNSTDDLKEALQEATKSEKWLRTQIDQLLELNGRLLVEAKPWAQFESDMLLWVQVAVGAACADRKINDAEKVCIKNLLFRGSAAALPSGIRPRIEATLDRRVSLQDAVKAAQAISSGRIGELLRDTIVAVMLHDEETDLNPAEAAWLDGWDDLMNTSSAAA